MLSQHKPIVCYYIIVGDLYLSYLTILKTSWVLLLVRMAIIAARLIFGLVGVLAYIPIAHLNPTDKPKFMAELISTSTFHGSMIGLFLAWFITASAVLALTDRYFAIVVMVAAFIFYVLGTKKEQQGRQNQEDKEVRVVSV